MSVLVVVELYSGVEAFAEGVGVGAEADYGEDDFGVAGGGAGVWVGGVGCAYPV